MFLGARGGGMRQESVWQCIPEVGPSQLGKRCQLGFGFGYWARLGAVFNGKKVYLEYITLIKHYLTLFTAIGGPDGMDAGGADWMTCFINRSRQPLWCLGARLHCWGYWGQDKYVFRVHYANITLSYPFHSY